MQGTGMPAAHDAEQGSVQGTGLPAAHDAKRGVQLRGVPGAGRVLPRVGSCRRRVLGVCCSARDAGRPPHTARGLAELLRGLPSALGGLALGLCGLGGLLIELQRVTDAQERTVWLMETAVYLTTAVAFMTVLLVCARAILCAEELRKELLEPVHISGHVACLYALMLICSRSASAIGDTTARVLQGAMIFPLSALIVRFIERCWRTSTYPEPIYNPPTNPAVVVLAGVTVAATPWLLISCFTIGALGGVSLVPAQAWRVLHSPEHVAPNISVWMLQAPASINAVMWGLLRRDRVIMFLVPWLSGARDNISHALFWYSVLLFFITLVAAWQRRKAIWSQGFTPRWVALTFPSCSTSIAALHYSWCDGPALSAWIQTPLQTYALVLSTLTCLMVSAVAIGVIGQQLKCMRTVWHATTPCDSYPAQKQAESVQQQQKKVEDNSDDEEAVPVRGTDSAAATNAGRDLEQLYPFKSSGSLVFDEPSSPRNSAKLALGK